MRAITASITFASIMDFARFIGVPFSAARTALENGTPINGYSLHESSVIIRGYNNGKCYDFSSLQEAANTSGIKSLKLLSLIESGDEYHGWTFDEI